VVLRRCVFVIGRQVGADGHVIAGIPCFAPSIAAAELEGSKTFAKDFMQRHSIPTATYRSFENAAEAHNYVDSVSHRLVIKADGLAAGKGVILPLSSQEAHDALDDLMTHAKFADAGSSVVIEEYMDGQEISVLTFSDGETWKSLPAGQDHKRVLDGNKGPNTGGMGVYAPLPFVTDEIMAEIEKEILQPTFEGMKCEGMLQFRPGRETRCCF
jgi:phosphoribosylamine--glycine ligase / phosphoribosylformylglycinamidine cyclo-ligase